jgi:L-alanine-DL-glutamate epimerase-like enolase superfamily enzyme
VTALEVGRGLEKHNAYWLEEPFDGHDIYGPARLTAEVDILITGGELAESTYEFLEFLVNRTYDIVQPDTRICGGIYPASEGEAAPCWMHGMPNASARIEIFRAINIQAGCSMTNCEWQEISRTRSTV